VVKFCECGCGMIAPLATRTRGNLGHVKGQPKRFVLGHQTNSAEVREKIAAGHRGKTHGPMPPETRAKISAAMNGRERTAEHSAKIALAHRGAKSRFWKGGRTDDRGYVRLQLGRGHPMADPKGRCYEHRLVMAAVIGRFLAPDEHVHHINGERSDNRPENLVILTASQHRKLHLLINRGADSRDAVLRVTTG
jgi:hypothetical protein